MTDNRFVNRSELIGIAVLAVFLVVILPLCLDVFRLNLVAKYLGVTAPFDIRAMYTDEFLDPSITMVDVPEMKF